MPFRRPPAATCDLIQIVLGSALPEDTILAEQARRLKMAVALVTSNPSGKEFALKCKELLKADSVGIFAVARGEAQLRSCAPLALLATSEPEDGVGADSGISQLRISALIHCVGAKEGATTLVECAGKCHSMHAVSDTEGLVIGVIEVARSAAVGGLRADELLLLRFVAPTAATAACAQRQPVSNSACPTNDRRPSARSNSLPDETRMARMAVASTAKATGKAVHVAVLGDQAAAAAAAFAGSVPVAATTAEGHAAKDPCYSPCYRSLGHPTSGHPTQLEPAQAQLQSGPAMARAARLTTAAVARAPCAIGVDIGPDGSFRKAVASKLLATVGGLAGHLQVEPLIRHIRQAAREVMGSEMCTVLLRDAANQQLVGQRSEEEGGEPFVLLPHTGLAGFVAKTGAMHIYRGA